jgi:hypothetical protein
MDADFALKDKKVSVSAEKTLLQTYSNAKSLELEIKIYTRRHVLGQIKWINISRTDGKENTFSKCRLNFIKWIFYPLIIK